VARIRTIKPEFWTSEQIVECSRDARLLFIGLWNFCDDAGRHPASLKRIKMEIFPGDEITSSNIRRMIDELINNELLLEYQNDGMSYWQVTGWKHQKIDRPTIKYPDPFDERSTNDHPRNGRESKGREGNGKEGSLKTTGSPTAHDDEKHDIAVPGLNLAAWSKWVDYRKQIKKPIKAASIEAAQKKMAKLGNQQMAAVDNSIAEGYQGLYPPRDQGSGGGKMSAVERVARANGLYEDEQQGGVTIEGELGNE